MMTENLIPTNESLPSGHETASEGGLTPEARLTSFLEERLQLLGYELVAIDLLNHREKKLCIYIDLLPESQADGVTIEDCVRVTRELDEPLESEPSIGDIFKGAYELEVSSPGIDRPLRKPSDFLKFAGEIARIHTIRPLTGDETGAQAYSDKNPKQKNFYGILRGFDTETRSIQIGLIAEDGTRGKPGKKKEPKPETPIRIPLTLVAKANLEREVKGL
jgi:ribosome maturation factor RimP